MEATRSITPGARSKTRPPAASARRVTSTTAGASAALGGDVDGLDRCAGVERHRQQLRPLDHHDPLGGPQAPLAEELAEPPHPLVGEGQTRVGQEPASAVAGAWPARSLATCTSDANASGSVTARSASTLRSTSTSARCRPAMNRL